MIDGTPVNGASQRGDIGGVIGRGVAMTGTHELPSFGNLTTVARPYYYLSKIIQVTSARL
jgi:hypothetical protein